MKILGIETSCDETAAAVVEIDDKLGCTLLSNVVASSMDLHMQYGGVVPEIAARSHIESIVPVIDQAIEQAFGLQVKSSKEQRAKSKEQTNSPLPPLLSALSDPWDQIDGIAVTYGAGLGGSLLIGVLAARTLAITKNKPLYAINHVEGHVYANFITDTVLSGYKMPSKVPEFPMLALIVSGGHSQLALFRDHFDYTLLGQTQDDAIGEAFDKVAKVLGLPYPGGPSIGKKAQDGDPYKYELPKAKVTSVNPKLVKLRDEMRAAKSLGLDAPQGAGEARSEPYISYGERALESATQQSAKISGRVGGSADKQVAAAHTFGYDFSFSGPKTAVLRLAQQICGKGYDFPSFELSKLLSEPQKADIAASFERTAVETVVDKTVTAFEEFKPASVVIAGGVAASPELRRQLAERLPLPIQFPDMKLCTDNGAMIATLGAFKAKLKQPAADPYKLDIAPNLSM